MRRRFRRHQASPTADPSTALAAFLLCLSLGAAWAPLRALVPGAPADTVPIRERAGQEVFDASEALAIADYGAFRVLLTDPGTAARRGFATAANARPYRFALGGRRFDPALEQAVPLELRSGPGGPGLPAVWRSTAPGDQLHLLQFAVPIRGEWLEALEGAGLEIVRAIQPHGVVVWGDHETVRLPAVESWLRYVGPFHPSYRLLPRLRDLPADEPVAARLLILNAVSASALGAAAEALGGTTTPARRLDARLSSMSVVIAGARLPDLAALPGVYAVHRVPTDGGLRSEISVQIHAGNVDGSNLALPGYLDWLDDLPSGTPNVDGLSGDGVVVAIVDTGSDTTHADLSANALACTGGSCQISPGSHGTVVAGIVAGDGSSSTTATSTNGDFLRGLGVAPSAGFVAQEYNPTYTGAGGLLELMEDSQANGASHSNNSWGPSGCPLGYDDDTMQVDIGVRDADPGTAGDQPFTYVLAVMNGNGSSGAGGCGSFITEGTQGTPDDAKNIITVGSTVAQQSATIQNTNIDDISSNTAQGPAEDGRLLPHLLAPGCKIDSTDNGGGYRTDCGTSYAAPHVAGTVALFIEQFRNRHGTDPSPALIKAALLGTARSLVGHLDADDVVLGHPPDNKQGWGRADPDILLDPPAAVAFVDQSHVFDGPGEEFEILMAVDDPAQPVRLMLVWTDAPGHGLGGSPAAWNNDLDLEVDDGSDTYLGNVFSGVDGWSVTGGTADPMNNTEGVFLEADAGRTTFVARVIAANVDSDGLPGSGDATDQDFALYCLNCKPVVLFVDDFESGDASAWE